MIRSILTVTSPAEASAKRLCTLAALKAELGINDSASDAALEEKIDQASASIAEWCQRAFAAEAVSETFRLSAPVNALVLDRCPVTTIASVTCDGRLLDAEVYEHDGRNGMLWRLESDARSMWPAAKVVVAYTAGYALPDAAPADLRRACMVLASTWWQSRGRDATLRSENTEGVDGVSYFDARNGGGGLPAMVTDLLESYRSTAV